jgi:hypothetical protein
MFVVQSITYCTFIRLKRSWLNKAVSNKKILICYGTHSFRNSTQWLPADRTSLRYWAWYAEKSLIQKGNIFVLWMSSHRHHNCDNDLHETMDCVVNRPIILCSCTWSPDAAGFTNTILIVTVVAHAYTALSFISKYCDMTEQFNRRRHPLLYVTKQASHC